MKASIEVKDRKEADYIRAALDDPVMRAQVVILGALSKLPSNRARTRVLQYVTDYFDENPGSSHSDDIDVARDKGAGKT